MKNYRLFAIIFFLLIRANAKAQITLNPAIDTINNEQNRQAIKTVINYLNARFQKKDAKSYFMAAETDGREVYDLYDAHNLYQLHFDDIIVLGITQPEKDLYKVKVLFDYIGTDKVKTIWSINEFYLLKQNNEFKLTNALYNNMRLNNYKNVATAKINYHFPSDYQYDKLKIDSANNFLGAMEHFFNKKEPGKIEYVTAPTCEKLYAVLGEEFQAATLSSTTSFCGYFDSKNRLIITSGNEFYKHELLRTLNLWYPNGPDLLRSGITTLWGGTANKPAIYHIKKMYPYLLKNPGVLDKADDFYYYDDETNPGFIFQAIITNYILKHDGPAAILKLMETLSPNTTMAAFLKDRYNITDLRAFFLGEFKYYAGQNRLEFDDLLKMK